MKIVILTQYFPPEPISFSYDLARSLAASGHQVRVVTAYPNWPSGEFHHGYATRKVTAELIDGIEVIRVPVKTGDLHSGRGRIMNYLSFAQSSLAATKYIRGADVTYVYSTPMTASTAATYWKLTFGIPFVLHIQDIWPESVTESALLSNPALKSGLKYFIGEQAKFCYRSASEIIVISPTMKKTLTMRGVPDSKIKVVYNWADESTVPQRLPTGSATPRTFLYAGNLGHFQDLPNVVRAFNGLGSDYNYELVLAGSGGDEQQVRHLAAGNPRIRLAGRLDRSELAEHYRNSDFQLVTLKDLPIFRGTVPSKLQSALCSGTPVITTVQGDVADLVSNRGLGLTAPAESPSDLTHVLADAIAMSDDEVDEMASRCRQFYVSNMSMSHATSALEESLSDASLRK